MMNSERYDRQIKLQGFGIKAQQKLAASRVLVAGAGGLGCPVLQSLAAAGIGSLAIVDDDRISISNLHRQILYATSDVGKLKTVTAKEKLIAMNPDTEVTIISQRITTGNAISLISDYDIIIDCTDNFPTRYMLDDACRLLKKPLIFGAVYQYEGQVAVFNVNGNDNLSTCYRNLFPEPPKAGEIPDCNEAGVLGVLTGIIGNMQANEAIKLIAGTGAVLTNRLMTINIQDYQTAVFDIPENILQSNVPFTVEAFENMDYESHCDSGLTTTPGISGSELTAMAELPDTLVIDLRNADELPKLPIPHISIPLADLQYNLQMIHKRNVILVCQSGKRSLAGARFLSEILGNTIKISHLHGGMNQFNNKKN